MIEKDEAINMVAAVTACIRDELQSCALFIVEHTSFNIIKIAAKRHTVWLEVAITLFSNSPKTRISLSKREPSNKSSYYYSEEHIVCDFELADPLLAKSIAEFIISHYGR